MTSKALTFAREQREMFLAEFQSGCQNLEEEIEPPSKSAANVRKIKIKMKLVKSSHDDCMRAQSQVVNLEKTSASDVSNRNWVETNLRKPLKEVMDKAEDKLIAMKAGEDPEADDKAQIEEAKREARFELTRFETTLKAKVDGLGAAYDETTIWLRDNHSALTESAEKLDNDLARQHLLLGKNYMKYLEKKDIEAEVTRQEKFSLELTPILAALQAKLLTKTPARVTASAPAAAVQHGLVGRGVQDAPVHTANQYRAKVKMAALPIPKFSGKLVDYPEWKKLFKDCVESQYEESAVVMIMRTQALPGTLTSIVPRCADLGQVWDKLDKQYLDPTRVWKGVKTDLKTLDRKKLGNAKYMIHLVSKILDAESLLESVGMVHWLRQEDKIPEYEDLLTEIEKLEWVRKKTKLTGTPWEKFKKFLVEMRDEYEEIAKIGTVDTEEKPGKEQVCDFCKKRNHTEENWRWEDRRKENLLQVRLGRSSC